jgi:hypothetical protein
MDGLPLDDALLVDTAVCSSSGENRTSVSETTSPELTSEGMDNDDQAAVTERLRALGYL